MSKNKKMSMYIAVLLEQTDTCDRVWLPLPASQKQFVAALGTIGVCEGGFRIVRYAVNVPRLTPAMLTRTPLAAVNYLASRLNGLTEADIAKLCAICDTDCCFRLIGQYINYTYAPDDYTLLPGVTDAEKLGMYYLGSVRERLPDLRLIRHVDRREFGRNIAAADDGLFTAHGYLTSKRKWRDTLKDRLVPDSLNLKGYIGEDIYGDWKEGDWDYGG